MTAMMNKHPACSSIRIAVLLLLCMLVLAGNASAAFAVEPIDLSHSVTLTVVFKYETTPIPDAHFSLYRVGNISEDADISLIIPFSDRFVVSGAQSVSGWDDLAKRMADYCQEMRVEASATGVTNEAGSVCLSKDGEPRCGLYLVVGEDTLYNGTTYTSLPFLLTLPSWDTRDGHWVYTVSAAPKVDAFKATPPTSTPLRNIFPSTFSFDRISILILETFGNVNKNHSMKMSS